MIEQLNVDCLNRPILNRRLHSEESTICDNMQLQSCRGWKDEFNKKR